MLKLQFLIGKKYNEEWSTVKNCNFSKLQFFKCNFTVISLHIFAVYLKPGLGWYGNSSYKVNVMLSSTQIEKFQLACYSLSLAEVEYLTFQAAKIFTEHYVQQNSWNYYMKLYK